MKKTSGRVSSEEKLLKSTLASKNLSTIVEVNSRPAPPYELSHQASLEWIKITNSMPATWFTPESHGILSQYCRHLEAALEISNFIQENFPNGPTPENFKNYANALYVQREEGKLIAALSTKLRITQQATINKRGNQIADANANDADPWSDDSY